MITVVQRLKIMKRDQNSVLYPPWRKRIKLNSDINWVEREEADKRQK